MLLVRSLAVVWGTRFGAYASPFPTTVVKNEPERIFGGRRSFPASALDGSWVLRQLSERLYGEKGPPRVAVGCSLAGDGSGCSACSRYAISFSALTAQACTFSRLDGPMVRSC